MRMFIPEIGTRIVLAEPWDITIAGERRNESVYERLDALPSEARQARNMAPWWKKWDNAEDIHATLPAGTELKVDRVYIRKGASEYSSITFYLTGTTHPLLISRKALRFWVKLDEVNKMEFNLVQEG